MTLQQLNTRREFGHLINAMDLTMGVEIGVAYGENAERILEQAPKVFLHLIDPWTEQSQHEWPTGTIIGNFQECYVYCKGKLSRFEKRTLYWRMGSDEAFRQFIQMGRQLDFVYVDGNHASPQVDRDIEQWYQLVRSGGILGGHDYKDEWGPMVFSNVKTAVDRFVAKYSLALHISDINSDQEPPSWWIQKP